MHLIYFHEKNYFEGFKNNFTFTSTIFISIYNIFISKLHPRLKILQAL